MDLLGSLPIIDLGGKETQAREIYEELTEAFKKGKKGIWYRTRNNEDMYSDVRLSLEGKGYKVFDQTKYKLRWVDGVPVRGAATRRYWIGVPGRS